jgi:hypothetical protein
MIAHAPFAQPLSNDHLALMVASGDETGVGLGGVEYVAACLKVVVHELH